MRNQKLLKNRWVLCYIKCMTAEEKQSVYKFLKAAKSLYSGYEAQGFSEDINFCDDMVQSNEPVKEEKAPESDKSSLASIASKISKCQKCPLHQTRLNTVPGEGVENPLVMVIGEGPGEEEDKSGRPFVGKAGQLLDKMLSAISLGRTKNCFIANIVKCRPPSNRTPFPQEAESCSGYLQAQIHLLKPKAILAMGRTAAQELLQTGEGIGSLHGKILDYNGIPFLATYHPSALLRNEDLKRPAWNDLKQFRMKLMEIDPDYEKTFSLGGNN